MRSVHETVFCSTQKTKCARTKNYFKNLIHEEKEITAVSVLLYVIKNHG